MARKSAEPLPLEEFESLADRAAQWVAEHASLVVGLVVALLVGTAAFSAYLSWSESELESAAADLARVRSEYLRAMGAEVGSLELPELANPRAAERVREEFDTRFREMGERHPSTPQAALAWAEVGDLRADSGDLDGAVEAWRRGLEQIPASSALSGALHARLGRVHEQAGRFQEAAQAHQQAGELRAYPLRYWALAEAARCYDRAGDGQRALELLERVDRDAPEIRLPEHLRTRLRELRAARIATSGAHAPEPTGDVAAGP